MIDQRRTGASPAMPFDETAGQIEAIYRTPDIAGQRRAILGALAPRPNERVLDVGCGPGFLAAELAGALGRGGRVVGIDRSPTMLALAQARCGAAGLGDRVELQVGDARRLPAADGAFDAAVAALTYEFSGDVGTALAEIHRVLRPGGRVLILDTDWDSVVWHAGDRALMELVLAAWVEHFADPYLPRTLGPRLRRAGFVLQRREVVPLFNPEWAADTYSFQLVRLIQQLVVGRRGLTRRDVEDWAADLRRLGEAQAYFFSLNRYLFLATKPGA